MSEKDTTGKGVGLDVEEFGAPSERRIDPRHLACFPAHIEVSGGVSRSALIRDLSVSGALLLTRAKVQIGDTIKLTLHLREGLDAFTVAGRVVREEKRPPEMVHPWTHAAAVQFETPHPEFEDEARALADRQAALAGRKAGEGPASVRSAPVSVRTAVPAKSPESLK